MSWRSLVAVLAVLVVVCGATDLVLAGPAISVPQTEFDFGHTGQHATVWHRFPIRSTGDDTLVITSIDPGCGCTQAPLADSVLGPGESTYLDLFFSTRSYMGKVDKTPFMKTNVSDEKVYLKIEANLITAPDQDFPLTLDPYRLDVSQFTPEERRVASAWIHNHDSRPYKLTLVDHADHVFEVKMPEQVGARDSAQVKIRVTDDYLDSEWDYSLTFRINDSAHTRYTLPIKRMLRVKDRDQ
ncbi:MAG TPA: DUF1573 domain-containing protein [candidate division Zixibacteria bacterium]|nr:DUF1573 domain-containing protein [candidate division Zixibacteria bacterium]